MTAHVSSDLHAEPLVPPIRVYELYPAPLPPGSPDLLRLVAGASEHVARLLGTGVSITACEILPGIEHIEISRGSSLIGKLILDLSSGFMAHLHSLGTWPETGGAESRDYQAGTTLLAAAISVFLLSELPMLYWTVDPRATGFYDKFFERYGPMLRWLDLSRTQIAGESEGEGDRVVLFRHSAPMRELALSRS